MTTETYNRTRKAFRLADALAGVKAKVSVPMTDARFREHVAALDDESWAAVAATADVGLPSEATRSAVLAILDERVATGDPFDGLTGSAAQR